MKVRAAKLVAPRKWQLCEEEKPQAKPGNMLVHIQQVAICGSDKPSFCGFHDAYPLPTGSTGHEGLGVVEACPSGTYKEGERVLLSGFDRGLFQEYVLANDHGVVRLPQDFAPEVVLLSQLLGTVIHSFYKLGNLINQRVVVIGQGAVGLLFDAVLRNLGTRQIIRWICWITVGTPDGRHSHCQSPKTVPGRNSGPDHRGVGRLVVEAVGERRPSADPSPGAAQCLGDLPGVRTRANHEAGSLGFADVPQGGA